MPRNLTMKQLLEIELKVMKELGFFDAYAYISIQRPNDFPLGNLVIRAWKREGTTEAQDVMDITALVSNLDFTPSDIEYNMGVEIIGAHNPYSPK